MRCNVCGRELPPGQMFCQCGNTVSNSQGGYEYDYNGGAGDLNVNSSSGKTMLIAVIAGIAVFAVIIAVIVSMLLGAGSNITDPTKWETVSTAHYQMTRPKSMKEIDFKMDMGNVTDLGTYRTGDVMMNIGTFQFTAEQKKYLKRKKVAEQLKSLLPAFAGEGAAIQERGNMCYTETEMDVPGAFFGNSKVKYVSAYYVSNNGMYVVQVITPVGKYAKYQDSIFAWMDSFRPN
ncbi:MAG: hypothetical protein K6F80_04510 [Oscillospiraceae bacterium]|nr:hypothetical protein [Oscillospiraceae bacterium]